MGERANKYSSRSPWYNTRKGDFSADEREALGKGRSWKHRAEMSSASAIERPAFSEMAEKGKNKAETWSELHMGTANHGKMGIDGGAAPWINAAK